MASTSSSNGPISQQQQYILAKLDSIALLLMQSLQLKMHKYFRVSVPQAFTGQSLIQNICDAFTLDDAQEALHLGTILMNYGYLFAVIEHAQSVRDDNTLYRMQLPYFWPSHYLQTDNVEYAIYLNKRLLRNEQKHGLDEDEICAYNKLVELLGHIWSFIISQAELQLKIQKEKRKIDKVVFDSQERAFWRLRRPGQSNILEEHIQKIEKRLRRFNIDGYKQHIKRMKVALKTKPWLKSIKGNEVTVQWTEAMHDYDPFLTQPQPSNPWISEDTSLWALNADNVEVPTEKRVKRWSLNVFELVKDPIGRQVLETFLESEFSSENLRFWISIQDLKNAPNGQTKVKAKRILEEFLSAGAPCQVNVDSRTLDVTNKCLDESDSSPRFAFSLAEEHVFTLMSKDSYPRFIRSQIYNNVLNAAQQQGSKRLGWRTFGPVKADQKRTPVTSKHKVSKVGEDEKNATSVQSPPITVTSNVTNNTLPKQHSSDSLPLKATNKPKASQQEEH